MEERLTDIARQLGEGRCRREADSLVIDDYFRVTESGGMFMVYRLYMDVPEWKCRDVKSILGVIGMNTPDSPGNYILNRIIAAAEDDLADDLARADDTDDFYPAYKTLYDAFVKIKAIAKELEG